MRTASISASPASENYQDLYDRALAAGFTAGQEGEIGGPAGRFAYLATRGHAAVAVDAGDRWILHAGDFVLTTLLTD